MKNNITIKTIVALFIQLISFNRAIGQPSCMIQIYMDGSIVKWVYSDGDEFNGESLDMNRWYTCEDGWRREHGLDELQYYLDDNIVLENGILKIISKYEPAEYYVLRQDENGNYYQILKHFDYSSGWIQTKQKYKYGLFEIRFKLPDGNGLWPAFWLFGGLPNEEIDVFEYLGETPNKVHCTVHYPPNNQQHNVITANGNFSGGFNVMRGQWDENWILWFLNDIPSPISVWYGNLNVQESVIANMAVACQGCFGSTGPDLSTPFPSIFEIDYIRIWTRYACEQDKTIENYHQTINDPTVVTGKSIFFNGNGNLLGNQFLTVIASEEIEIRSDFIASEGSVFSAKIVECPEIPETKGLKKEDNVQIINVNENRTLNSEKESINLDPKPSFDKIVENTSNLELSIIVFPNPSQGEIHVNFEGEINRFINISLYDSFGKEVYSNCTINSGNLAIDITSLSKGMYILVCQIDNNLITEKVIVE